MAFDIPIHTHRATEDHSVSQALFNDSTTPPPIIKVGSLEPTGPGGPTVTQPPTEVTNNRTTNITNNRRTDITNNRTDITNNRTDITNNRTTNVTKDTTNIHDTTNNTRNVSKTTNVTNETVNPVSGSGGSNVLKQVIGGTTVLPNTPGDGCTKSLGAVIGVGGLLNLGGVESHPDDACNKARNEIVKEQTQCAFTVDAANMAIQGLNSAGQQVDIAGNTGSKAHLDIANQQRRISEMLAAGAASSAGHCVGDIPPDAAPPPSWTASDLNGAIAPSRRR